MAVTITYLVMFSADEIRRKYHDDGGFQVREVTPPQWRFNRSLYCTIGVDWAWNDQRSWTDEQWRTYAESPGLRTFGAWYGEAVAGYYELLPDPEGGIQIAYFGLLPAFVGRGFGGALLTNALEEAWRMSPDRVWVHTCTLDHPSALANYEARGMRVYRTETGS